MLDRYFNEMTLHGVSKIYAGRSIYERLLWVIFFSATLAISIKFLWDIVERYLEYDTVSIVSTKRRDEYALVTVCSHFLFLAMFICHNGYFQDFNDAEFSYPNNCTKLFREQSQWRVNSKYQKVNEACIQFNTSSGNNTKTLLEYEISIYFTNWFDNLRNGRYEVGFFVYFHSEVEELEIDGLGDYGLSIDRTTTFNIQENIVKRLKTPYTSNCSDEPDAGYSIFPRKYSPRSCHFSCRLAHMYQMCGAVGDNWMQFIPKKLKNKYNNSKSEDETRDCLLKYTQLHPNHQCQYCPKLCKQKYYNLVDVRHAAVYNKYGLKFAVSHQELAIHSSEKALFGVLDIIISFGGILGLLTGCSALSVIEILAVLVLSLGALLRRR